MSETFTERPCEHCRSDIESQGELETLGEYSLHRWCVDEFTDITPKLELTPYQCDICPRGYWTERGLQHHRERIHG